MTTPPYQPPSPNPNPPDRGFKNIAIGCGVVALVLVLLAGASVWYTVRNFKSIATGFGTAVLVEVIEKSSLPDDQKHRLIARTHQLAQDYESGKISYEQLQSIGEYILESPILYVGSVLYFHQQYLASSTLSQEEKLNGHRTLQRLARGVYEKSIPSHAVQQVIAPISETDFRGQTRIKDNPTDDELRHVLKIAKQLADQALVPDEPFDVDLIEEFDRAVENAMTQP